jgi:hypothetical protein
MANKGILTDGSVDRFPDTSHGTEDELRVFEYAVIRPESMRSAEITSYKLTCRSLSAKAEALLPASMFVVSENSERADVRNATNGTIGVASTVGRIVK